MLYNIYMSINNNCGSGYYAESTHYTNRLYPGGSTGFLITSSATSTLSLENAQCIADSVSSNNANIIDQTLNIISILDYGITGPTGPSINILGGGTGNILLNNGKKTS